MHLKIRRCLVRFITGVPSSHLEKGWLSQLMYITYPNTYLHLIDLTTLGRARFDPGPKPLPWLCRITKSQGVAERSDRGIGGGKCSFPA